MSQTVLYGLSDASKAYMPVRFFIIDDETSSVFWVKRCAYIMAYKNPDVKTVYAVDNSRKMKKHYLDCIKKSTMSCFIEFKDILEKEGIRVL